MRKKVERKRERVTKICMHKISIGIAQVRFKMSWRTCFANCHKFVGWNLTQHKFCHVSVCVCVLCIFFFKFSFSLQILSKESGNLDENIRMKNGSMLEQSILYDWEMVGSRNLENELGKCQFSLKANAFQYNSSESLLRPCIVQVNVCVCVCVWIFHTFVCLVLLAICRRCKWSKSALHTIH